jgi:hypothetical protein
METPAPHENPAASPPGQPQGTSRKATGGAIAGVAIVLLVLSSVVAWYVQAPPTAVARKYLVDQGVAAEGLELAGFQDHGIVPVIPFPKDATVEFRVKGAEPPRKLEVNLSRTVYFLPWHATGFREKAEK